MVANCLALCGFLGTGDEICIHGGRVLCCSNEGGEGFSYLLLSSKECCAGAREPCGEEAGVGWCLVMDCVGIVIRLYVDLGVRGKFFVGFVAVLMAFDVEEVDLDWHVSYGGSDGLNDIIVWT